MSFWYVNIDIKSHIVLKIPIVLNCFYQNLIKRTDWEIFTEFTPEWHNFLYIMTLVGAFYWIWQPEANFIYLGLIFSVTALPKFTF